MVIVDQNRALSHPGNVQGLVPRDPALLDGVKLKDRVRVVASALEGETLNSGQVSFRQLVRFNLVACCCWSCGSAMHRCPPTRRKERPKATEAAWNSFTKGREGPARQVSVDTSSTCTLLQLTGCVRCMFDFLSLAADSLSCKESSGHDDVQRVSVLRPHQPAASADPVGVACINSVVSLYSLFRDLDELGCD